MSTSLLLLLCLTGPVFSQQPPDVDCLVINLDYVHCSWNKQGTPEVNYTFSGWFHHDKVISECPSYQFEDHIRTGCKQPYGNLLNRFDTFHTELRHDAQRRQMELDLKSQVQLYPPANLTVQNESDSNLWLRWVQTEPHCVESEVRYRVNGRNWATSHVSVGVQSYCINLPSRTSLYELQVRSRMGHNCAGSTPWSVWSESVFWGSNNGTEPNTMNSSVSVWTPVVSLLGALVLMLLALMLLHHERIRIIFVPVVPKPSPKLHNVEDWFQFPKVLKESFNYNERPCPVREYCHVPEADSSSCSSCSVTTDQTDCSIFISENQQFASSSSSSVSAEEEEQVSV